MRALHSPAMHVMSQPACTRATWPPHISQSLRIGSNAGNNLIFIYECLHDSLNPRQPFQVIVSLCNIAIHERLPSPWCSKDDTLYDVLTSLVLV